MIIYGYLEIKKISNRFDSLNSKIESMIRKNEQKDETVNEGSPDNTMEEIINQNEGKTEETVYEEERRAEELMNSYNDTVEDIHSETSEELGWSAEREGKIIDLNVSPEENFKELIIQKINNGSYDDNRSYDNPEIEEISDSSSEESIHIEADPRGDSEEGVVYPSEEKEVDQEGVSILNMEDDTNQVGELNLGEMDLDDDEDDETVIDDKLSVSQLRGICKELKLPQSGNKSTLIKRIQENK